MRRARTTCSADCTTSGVRLSRVVCYADFFIALREQKGTWIHCWPVHACKRTFMHRYLCFTFLSYYLPSGSSASLHQCVQPFSRFQEKRFLQTIGPKSLSPFLIYFLVFLIYVLTSKTQFYTFELPLLLPPSPSCRHDPPLTLRTMRWKNDGSSELLAGRRERSLASCVLLYSRFPPFPLSHSEICMLRTISIRGCGNQKGKFHEISLYFMKFHEISRT